MRWDKQKESRAIMFDKETMAIIEIIKAAPDNVGDYYDFPMKLFTDLAAEADKRNIPRWVLESGLKRLPQQGLARVFYSHGGTVHGVIPTPMFDNLFP